jgi:hypothetical protein
MGPESRLVLNRFSLPNVQACFDVELFVGEFRTMERGTSKLERFSSISFVILLTKLILIYIYMGGYLGFLVFWVGMGAIVKQVVS